MSEKIDQFCNSLREQLTKVECQLNHIGESIKAAPQEAEAAIRSKIEVAQATHEGNKQKIAEVKTKIADYVEAKKNEVETDIQQWKINREIKKLDHRADKAESYAVAAIDYAAAAVVQADLATLEAIAARIEADEVKDSA
jgi:hypothetical protein